MQRIRTILAACSLVLCVMMAASAVTQAYWTVAYQSATFQSMHVLEAESGELRLHRVTCGFGALTQSNFHLQVSPHGPDRCGCVATTSREWRIDVGGFGVSDRYDPALIRVSTAKVPLWFVALLLAIPPWRRWRQRLLKTMWFSAVQHDSYRGFAVEPCSTHQDAP